MEFLLFQDMDKFEFLDDVGKAGTELYDGFLEMLLVFRIKGNVYIVFTHEPEVVSDIWI